MIIIESKFELGQEVYLTIETDSSSNARYKMLRKD